MKKILLSLGFILFLIACNNKEQQTQELTNEIAITETPVLEIGEFDIAAGDYVNKEIQINGIVDHVCKHGGKKLLLVNNDGDIHVTADERFPDDLIGEEILLTGIVVEERIDESTCMQMDEDNMKSHSEGDSDDEFYEKKKQHIQAYRDSMEVAGVDHLSYYSLEYVSLERITDEAIN